MSSTTLNKVIKLVQHLSLSDKAVLLELLQQMLPPYATRELTLEDINAEHARRRAAGEFAPTVSLMGKYARPDLDLSYEEIEATIHDASTEWEQELDELLGDD